MGEGQGAGLVTIPMAHREIDGIDSNATYSREQLSKNLQQHNVN